MKCMNVNPKWERERLRRTTCQVRSDFGIIHLGQVGYCNQFFPVSKLLGFHNCIKRLVDSYNYLNTFMFIG